MSVAPITSPVEDRSSFGLKSATWKQIRKVLRRLGGEDKRTTGKHASVLMELPTGGRVACGKHKDRNLNVLADALQQLFEELRRADVDPLLFCALLKLEGVAWYKTPGEVSKLARYLQRVRPDLTGPDQWRRVLAEWGAEERRKAEALAEPKPQQESEEPAPRDPGSLTFAAKDVLDLAGIEAKEERQRASSALGYGMLRRVGIFATLQDRGEAARIEVEGRKHKANRFTEIGAMVAADELVRRYGPEESRSDEPVTMPDPEPEQPAEEPQQPAEEPAAEVPTPSRNGATTAPAGTPYAALLRICEHYGIEPSYKGFGLDVDRIIMQVAAKLR